MNSTIRAEYLRVPSKDRTYISAASRFDKIREKRNPTCAPRRTWFIRAQRKSFIPQLSPRENILIRATEFNSRSISAAVISTVRSFSLSLSLWKYFSYPASDGLVSLRTDVLFSYAFIEFIIPVHHYSLHYWRIVFCCSQSCFHSLILFRPLVLIFDIAISAAAATYLTEVIFCTRGEVKARAYKSDFHHYRKPPAVPRDWQYQHP